MTISFSNYDESDLLGITSNVPDESKKAFENAVKDSIDINSLNNLLISGMGGSCISGDLLKSYLYSKSQIPVLVNRSSVLPNFINDKSLCVFLSYSGNTQETINCYKQAIEKKSQCIVITSGGQIEKLAIENNHKIIKINGSPKMPRVAVGELFYSLIGVLSAIKDLNIDIKEISYSLNSLSEINENSSSVKEILDLCQNNKDKKIAVFGVSPSTESIALRWKTQLNENSKVTAIFNSFPELTHNEIVNLSHNDLENYLIIVLRDKSEDNFVKKQIDATLEILEKATIKEIKSDKDSLLERMIALVYLGDYFSIYHALINQIDPSPIDTIMSLKEKMKE